MADQSSLFISSPRVISSDHLDGPRSNLCGNRIFNEDHHCSPPPHNLASEVPRHIEPNSKSECPSAYAYFRGYHERIRTKYCTSPEQSRRYFTDLEGITPQSTLSEEFSFTGHLSRRTSQLDRMDMNVATGKNSLFISNGEDGPSEVTDVMYDNAIRTDSGAKLLLAFTRETFLGEGRHSRVYRGTLWVKGATELREVAVKLAFKQEESVEYLYHELEILKTLSCPHIIKVIDTFKVKGKGSSIFANGYLTEIAEFGTLESFVLAKDVFSLSLARLLSWMRQFLLALKTIKDNGITHFDIKPQNILVMKDYSLNLGDFGEAVRLLAPDFGDTRGRGTLHYTAPELLSIDQEGLCDGPAVDMYSAGLVFYSLITGRMPWMELNGHSTHQILTCRKGFDTGSYNPLPSADADHSFKLPGPNGEKLPGAIVKVLIDLVKRCTAFAPDDRCTVEEALQIIDSITVS